MIAKKNTRDQDKQAFPQDKELAFIDRFFKWFECKVLNLDKEYEGLVLRRRVVLLAVITFIGVTTLLIFSLLAFYQGAFWLGVMDIFFSVAFALNLLWVRIKKSYQLNITVGIIIASWLYILLYVNGGLNRTAFVWYFTFPLMASFLLGSKKGAMATLLMTIPILTLLVFDFQHPFFASYAQIFEIRFLGAYLLVGVFAYMFEKSGEDSRQETLEINQYLEDMVEHRTVQLIDLNQQLIKEIEQHKHAQVLLTKSEQRYRVLIDLSAVGILIGSHDGYVIEANKCLCDIVGVDKELLVGLHISELPFTKESLSQEPFRFDLLQVGHAIVRERNVIRPDGTIITVKMQTVMMPDKTYQSIFTDVTQRNKIEQNLRASEERFRLAFSTSPDSININKINDGTYVDINNGFTKILGYTRADVLGKTSVSLDIWKNPEDRDCLVAGLKKHGYVENLEAEFIGKNGMTKIGLMSASIITINEEVLILSITRDITDRKREEEDKIKVEGLLQQAQKLEAVGTLAGGIAHDFNNLLMGIQGRTSLMAITPQQSEVTLEHIREINEYVRSASNLTKQLLGVARGGKYDPRPADLNTLIETSSVMFGRTRKEITIHKNYSSVAIVAVVDRAQLEQVMLNLYVNAWQAMPDGGALRIDSETVFLESEYCDLHKVDPGRFAKISVTDNGIGMDEATLQQVFDPFFTTKEKGRGTGLGLASAYGIIKNHGGFITVNSNLGQGTTFTLYLPLSEMEVQQEILPEVLTVKGSELVLLVDDEKMIIEVGSAMLKALGYTVICAQGGKEAIRYVEEADKRIDLVILDLIMPEIDGRQTFDRIHEISPLTPVILSSGYALDGQATEIMARGCNGFIQKPFNLSELSQKIRSVIDKKDRH